MILKINDHDVSSFSLTRISYLLSSLEKELKSFDLMFTIKRLEDIKEILVTNFSTNVRYFYSSNIGFTLHENEESIVVYSVDPGSMAAKQGMRKNDIVLKVNDYNVVSHTYLEFGTFMFSLSDSERTAMTLKRGDDIIELVFIVE